MAFFDPSECFLRRLNGFVSLPNEDRRLIQSLTPHAEPIPADQDIIREGDKSDNTFLISGGFACRYKLVGNGRRQVVGFLMPGDTSVVHGFALDAIDHNIATVTKAQVVTLSQRDVLTLQDRSAISRALLMVSLVNEATGRDWLANIGSRCAEQRVIVPL